MRDPEQALEAARAASRASAQGRSPAEPGTEPDWPGVSRTSARRLAAWAIIEPEQAEVYSTRRFGRPITWLKRLLIRLLTQYLGQISAQQSRFNASVAAHVIRLEERVETLERTLGEREERSGLE